MSPVADFADRCKKLARKITPHVEEESARKLCNEQVERMLLSSFTSGLQGNPGKHTRFSMPSTMEAAIKIAVPVEQAEDCDRRNDSFSVIDQSRNTHYTSYAAGSDEKGKSAPSRNHEGRNTRGPKAPKCFECCGVGHWAQVCANRLALTATSDRAASGPNRDIKPNRGRREEAPKADKPSGN
jgi:hypothetical protein